ncbi:MAG: hypothetical protein EOP88_14520 [Verrucomicrobiaceae bacterium]|nr:MAG: hypothetical protein EOP88_14520 [Verrucomicrobiaceae bacterium]
MNFPTGVLVAAVGAAVGFLAAVGTRDTGGEGRGDAGRGKAVTGSPGREEYQLSKLEQVLKQKGPGPNYRAHMERLTTEELRGLLRELSLTQLEQVHRNPYANNPPALGEAAEELYRREGLAALQWATGDGFIPDSPQGDLLRVLLLVAVAEDPAGAKPWVDAYQKALEGSMAGAWNPFIEQAIRAASSQGVDALLRLKEIYGVDVLGKADLTTGQLPADFDFKRLLQEFPQSHGLNATVRLWAAKDPEGAWKALREMDAENKWTTSRYATSLFTGMSQTMGEEAATKWLASRLDEVSGPYRDRLLFSLLNDQRMNYQVAEQASIPCHSGWRCSSVPPSPSAGSAATGLNQGRTM